MNASAESFERLLNRKLQSQTAGAAFRDASAPSSSDSLENEIASEIAKLSMAQKTELFISVSHLASALEYLSERQWIFSQEQDGRQKFDALLATTLSDRLESFAFLIPRISSHPKAEIKSLRSFVEKMASTMVGMTRVMPSMEFESFVREAMRQIQDLVLAQTRIPLATSSEGHELQSSPSLYRAFDAMDEILGLDYERDRGMRRDLTTDQRLYEGAGAGVQSSYETILLALERLSLPAGSVLVDLGSGYGRVGLVIGLLRPDLKFVGYEYVGHRVEVSCASAQRAGVGDRVKFFEQDLSADDFALPVADAYYLFDPFTAETYERVFAKIKELGRHKVTAVVAKGHAGRWFKAALGDASGWDTPIGFDQGTLELFRSQIR